MIQFYFFSLVKSFFFILHFFGVYEFFGRSKLLIFFWSTNFPPVRTPNHVLRSLCPSSPFGRYDLTRELELRLSITSYTLFYLGQTLTLNQMRFPPMSWSLSLLNSSPTSPVTRNEIPDEKWIKYYYSVVPRPTIQEGVGVPTSSPK